MSTDTETTGAPQDQTPEQRSLLGRVLGFCLHNRLVVALGVAAAVFWALAYAPFGWDLGPMLRDPVPVDAIPDIGENQQIIFTDWPGRSPRDVDDQITYPLTTQLLGVKDVKVVRSTSMFGFSSIYVIFRERADFDDTRNLLTQKLLSLPEGLLPEGVQPRLGPEATALGQVFWYTLEGRDPKGNPAGGWDLEELRTVQDWQVRYALASTEGVAEVASIGGFVREYQVDLDPDALRAYDVTLGDVYAAIRASNIDVSAKTIELNNVEYLLRGIGFIRAVGDIENAVVKVRDNVPILVRHVGVVALGPAWRGGALDKEGAEAVGGVVVARFGSNPLAVIGEVKRRIAEVAPSLPEKTLPDGTVSKVAIVPFYDRTGLIHETLGTLEHALRDEILVTIVVVVLMVMHLRSSALISLTLPLTVGICFVAMKLFGVDANVVALSGIAIAIGTIVDMGIVICENVLRHLAEAPPGEPRIEVVHRAASEVGSAVLTAVATTVVGFLPVFVMSGPEGKLFKPLAFTKTFALVGSILVALLVLPVGAQLLFRRPRPGGPGRRLAGRASRWSWRGVNVLLVLGVLGVLAVTWRPLGRMKSLPENFLLVLGAIGGLMAAFLVFQRLYPRILRWCLNHKALFLSLPVGLLVLALLIWLGFPALFAPAAAGLEKASLDGRAVRSSTFYVSASRTFPGLGQEFMPALDEGSFLYMPSTMVHASIAQVLEVVSRQDRAIRAIPEVDSVVGKLGRVDSPLDPAPVSMIETIVTYKDEYARDESGAYVRQWRDHIRTPDDIWNEITRAAAMPGVTGAPKLQPIATRIVMLQTGMRAAMGIKVQGPDLPAVERAGIQIERLLRQVPSVRPETVAAERIVAKPYLVIDPTGEEFRQARTRYGLNVEDVLRAFEAAVGGMTVTTTVEGRQRFDVRVRYLRELRDDIDSLRRIVVAGSTGQQVPLGELAEVHYEPGPQMIKSENTFKVGYVTFDKRPGWAEVDVVNQARAHLQAARARGELDLPAGVTYSFAGTYENQVHAQRTLAVVVPMALVVIFFILYLHFRSTLTALLVFTGVGVAFSGGFLLLWLYGQGWFLDFSVFGRNLRDVFAVHTVNLSVAVWVGFLALFGIATDDGVVMGTYLAQSFRRRSPDTVPEVRGAVLAAGQRRIRPCLMTTATTILALLPVLTSTGRGSDIMVPMAIPSFGGMVIQILTMLVVPVLYCLWRERQLKRRPAGP